MTPYIAGGKQVLETTRRRHDIGQAPSRVVGEFVCPGSGGLLQSEFGPLSVHVSVRDTVAGKGSIFSQQLVARGVTISRRADAVHHVRQSIESVVRILNRARDGIVDIR